MTRSFVKRGGVPQSVQFLQVNRGADPQLDEFVEADLAVVPAPP